jgi:hypothetical protein
MHPRSLAPGEEDGAAIEMAFSKKKVEERKAWLSAFQPGTYLDQSVNTISYSDFVHKVGPASTTGGVSRL